MFDVFLPVSCSLACSPRPGKALTLDRVPLRLAVVKRGDAVAVKGQPIPWISFSALTSKPHVTHSHHPTHTYTLTHSHSRPYCRSSGDLGQASVSPGSLKVLHPQMASTVRASLAARSSGKSSSHWSANGWLSSKGATGDELSVICGTNLKEHYRPEHYRPTLFCAADGREEIDWPPHEAHA